MLEFIWELMGGPILAFLTVCLVLVMAGARRITAVADILAKGPLVGAREDADPLAKLSFDERLAARLKELEAEPAPQSPAVPDSAPNVVPARSFGRKRA